jgi:hypothetical protein
MGDEVFEPHLSRRPRHDESHISEGRTVHGEMAYGDLGLAIHVGPSPSTSGLEAEVAGERLRSGQLAFEAMRGPHGLLQGEPPPRSLHSASSEPEREILALYVASHPLGTGIKVRDRIGADCEALSLGSQRELWGIQVACERAAPRERASERRGVRQKGWQGRKRHLTIELHLYLASCQVPSPCDRACRRGHPKMLDGQPSLEKIDLGDGLESRVMDVP